MNSKSIAVYESIEASELTAQAANDAQLIELWLAGRPANTARLYRRHAEAFLAYFELPLRTLGMAQVLAYGDTLASQSPRSQAAGLSAVKSLLSFAHRLGYIPFNVGAPVKLPKIKDDLAQRILSEDQVIMLLQASSQGKRYSGAAARDKTLLRFLYLTGARVSEAAELRWHDLQARSEGEGQATLFGKGGKTRAVILPASLWSALCELRGEAADGELVFRGRQGEGMTARQIGRIVQAAAERAGIKGAVSPHFLRHCHASHSLDRGAKLHVVQQTLGHSNTATTGRYLHVRPNESSSRYLIG